MFDRCLCLGVDLRQEGRARTRQRGVRTLCSPRIGAVVALVLHVRIQIQRILQDTTVKCLALLVHRCRTTGTIHLDDGIDWTYGLLDDVSAVLVKDCSVQGLKILL